MDIARASLAKVESGAQSGGVQAQRAEISRLEADQFDSVETQKATIARTQAESQFGSGLCAIARALASRPKIVLADEPTAALDKKSGRDVVNFMHDLAREQKCTILLVTHDNRILDIADRIVYMEDGRLSKQPEMLEAVHS